MNPPRRPLLERLSKGIAAQGFAQFVQLFVRLGEVPLFLSFWGATGYGEWLMIAAVGNAMTLSDAGYARTAQREIAIRAARLDSNGVKETFQSAGIVLLLLPMLAITLFCLLQSVIDFREMANLTTISSSSLTIAIILIAVKVMIIFQCDLLNGGFASTGSYGQGTFFGALTYLLGFVGVACAVLLGGKILAVTVADTLGCLLGLVIMRMALARNLPMVRYGYSSASRKEIKRLFLPSLANLAFPFGETLNVQGVRILIGTTLGPTPLVVFSTLRTLCRIALQAVGSIARTIEPEISLAYGALDEARVRKFLTQGTQMTLWCSMAICLVIALIGEPLFEKWTGGSISFDWKIGAVLLIASLVNSVWCVALMIPTATNQHLMTSLFFASIHGLACVTLSAVAVHFYGTLGVAFVLLIVEICMGIAMVKIASSLARQPLRDWLTIATTPPWKSLITLIGGFYRFKHRD